MHFHVKKTWTEARKECQGMGADLASPLSYNEFDEIIASIQETDERRVVTVWIGARLNGTDIRNDWYWISGEPLPVNYLKWADFEPDNVIDGCAFMAYARGYSPDLRTWTCDSDKIEYLCQYGRSV